MASTATVQASASVAPIAASTPMKKKATTKKAGAAAPAHPTTAVMVIAAIKALNEKKGSSLSAIKKYTSTNYNVDSTKLAPFIRKFLKAAVVKGTLLQTNGTGAMGHFKLPVEVKKKPAVVKNPKKTTVAKQVTSKKPAKASSVGTPKKRKIAAKKAPTAAEPIAKKPKAAVTAKPKKKSLVKAKKAVVTPKPPKAKKATAVKKAKTPKKK